MNKIIVGMGEALWDVLPEGKKIGGAPANFAYHVSQFGFDSRVVSAVGRDDDGQEILETSGPFYPCCLFRFAGSAQSRESCYYSTFSGHHA